MSKSLFVVLTGLPALVAAKQSLRLTRASFSPGGIFACSPGGIFACSPKWGKRDRTFLAPQASALFGLSGASSRFSG